MRPFCILILGFVAKAQQPITLPIEVVGQDGTTAAVNFTLPSSDARTLRLQIHNLAYPDMVSVKVNTAPWLPLNNNTAAVAAPANYYGGIGGGFATITVTLPLQPGVVFEGDNKLSFRFNRSDGVASGFRVLSFNFLDAAAHPLIPSAMFQQEDPATWVPPLPEAASIRAGKDLWESAPLSPGGFQTAPLMRARCANCHARDGRDLKYFCFSNASIIARSRFHGLSEREGEQIASYIRSLPLPSPGRPWNPPYQPGPALDRRPAADWAAGAGLEWVLDDDSQTLPFLFSQQQTPVGQPLDWPVLVPRITRETFRPDGNLDLREIPIAFQLPDWNHWLPQVHPLDAWGSDFDRSDFAAWYENSSGKPSLRRSLAASNLADFLSTGRIVADFDKWRDSRHNLLKPYLEGKSVKWTPALGVKAYATQLWQLVKTWELTQEFSLETRGRELYGAEGEPRTWLNTIPAAAAPATVNIPDGPSGMGGSALTNEYFDAAWYQLQIIVNSGNHRHRNRGPIDWVYLIGRYLDLYRETRHPEPGRLLLALTKSLQSTDPRIGPRNREQGWRPRQTVDPTILVSEVWTPLWGPLPSDAKRALVESVLAAWLDKTQQYTPGQYFTPGVSEDSYVAPASLGGIVGGRVWEMAPLFRAAGVSPELVSRLQKWGAAYLETAARFQYTDASRSRGTGKSGK